MSPLLAAGFSDEITQALVFGGIVVAVFVVIACVVVVSNYGALWFQAYMSGADVSLFSLIGMSLRKVSPRMIVTARIMSRQAGLDPSRRDGLDTARLEAHCLAGGDVMRVLRAIIAADRAGLDLDFDRAAAIDLAGRDVLEAVRTSVSPKVIECPDPRQGGAKTLNALARNGVELRVRARVTVRTSLDRLIGGATEETIVARVGQGIVTAVAEARTHLDVLNMPDRISKGLMNWGLDANTAFEIVSIDIASIEVGENVGARLQIDQAEADMRMAQAKAEVRRADAVATLQEMVVKKTANRALLVLAESQIPVALADAIRGPTTGVRASDWKRLDFEPNFAFSKARA